MPQGVRRLHLLLSDHRDRLAPDELVFEYHPVRIEDLRVFLPDLLLERANELLKLLLGLREGVLELPDLGVNLTGADVLLGDRKVLDVDDERLAEGDARRSRIAVERYLYFLGLRVVH